MDAAQRLLRLRGIGDRVRAAREKRGMSQAELARQVETSAYAMNLLEQGGTPTPRADRVFLIADILQVTADYLLGLSEDIDIFKKS